ncbi:dTDP-4-dehydrorhamnose reductase [Paenibacillus sp. R14(2021)]|uniref:dTDP-4-dehydrorhamnose reductase n=1 Tax=Paenibacillus sp. R14(2021) TaxID=2859228 RepID=UPI001C616210|nr:dTDP-4-dehydrorhamnose reductase [Paenibacillus sp. R14(2021)]
MKILVTGANGQLGQEIVRLTNKPGIHIIGLGRDKLDITNAAQCREVFAINRPDVVIHTAAYTAVDEAESDPDEAFRINAEGTRNVALAAEETGAKFCYVSTDYVFDGTSTRPYKEDDSPNPQTVYGKSKLAGEREVQTLSTRHFIVRTSWVFGKYGGNFVKTILKLAEDRDQLKVVSDQFGSPTYTLDLAVFLVGLVQTEHFGIFHASNRGACTWFDFAHAILQESGNTRVKLEACSTAEFPRPAARPAYSVMRHAAIERYDLNDLRPWREALIDYLGEGRP